MAELGRVAQAAIRSASLLRVTPIRSQPCRSLILASSVSGRKYMSTTPSLRSSSEPARPSSTPATSPAETQQKPHAPAWTNPSRLGRGTTGNIADIYSRKPNVSSYDLPFGGPKGKEQKNDDQEPVEFASDLLLDLADIIPNRFQRGETPAAPQTYLRMVPRTGRTVYVRNNVDVARSFKLLAVQVSQNGLRRDYQAQRFYERPGKKRKRLASDRWRKRFQKGFKATVSRVRELTAQGW
ncbi:hypothetical protein F4782DRAFT_510902 [Xylaria castorea]|nr:hypothetical protein F4782DRAFT_510902 [Xylaria castorea]